MDGRKDGGMDGRKDGGMDGGWMDGMLKNIKIEDYILYAKNNYEGGRRKIYPKNR
jgi:hypothetical protein